jgi:DNA-binding NtrC family response regulator/PAS domain-containing protein
MTQDKSSENGQTDQQSHSVGDGAVSSLNRETRPAAEMDLWAWEEIEVPKEGLAWAGVILWKWNVQTGELRIQPHGTLEPFLFPSPTTWEQLVHPDDIERFYSALHKFQERDENGLDCRFRVTTEIPRWVHVRNTHSATVNGEPAIVFGLFFDVTEAELTRERYFSKRDFDTGQFEGRILFSRMLSEIRRQEKDYFRLSNLQFAAKMQFSLIQDLTDLPAFKTNAELAFIEANEAMGEILEKPSEEILQHSVDEVWGEDEASRLKDLFKRALSGEPVTRKHDMSFQEGSIHVVDVFFPDFGDDGTVRGVCGIMLPVKLINDPLVIARPIGRGAVSAVMRNTYQEALLAAQFDMIVLLTGESGTGKDHIARYIHGNSSRCSGRYFSINCAAIPGEMAESELFGHEKGSFTGAHRRKRGLLELAEGGTLLLNEIGELPPTMQAKLLTFLDTKSFVRVGGEKSVRVDARIIAATHRDLGMEVAERRFMEPLFYRLSVFSIWVPPLRERLEDIPMIVSDLLVDLATETKNSSTPNIEEEALKMLQGYTWPGNVRELRNALERAIAFSGGSTITASSISDAMHSQTSQKSNRLVISDSPHYEVSPRPAPSTSSGPALRPVTDLTDEEFKEMYRETCVKDYDGTLFGMPGAAAVIGKFLKSRRETVSRRIKRLRLPKVKQGPISQARKNEFMLELQSWANSRRGK